ncbi:MAG: MptD family putative ECF transporter S component [Deltaproteobacteria bacterium]|nr:MptD family putative ECF transporter S component [Deltaproteobacteria bacterium]
MSIRSFWDGKGLFETHELVTIGLFAAGAKASALVIALVGGGMNPLTMILKSAVYSALLVVLLAKVPKTGTLTLANLVGALLAFFLMGQSMLAIPALVIGTLLVELFIKAIGGLERHPGYAILTVALSEFVIRFINLGVSYLMVREQPQLLVMVVVVVAFSYLGIIVGLVGGYFMTRELRHAGLLQ